MRSPSKSESWRSVMPTVTWTLVCLVAMTLVLSIIAIG
jgi:hypothetical protein